MAFEAVDRTVSCAPRTRSDDDVPVVEPDNLIECQLPRGRVAGVDLVRALFLSRGASFIF